MITSITALGRARRDLIYDTVANLAPRLFVDVGEPADHTTRLELRSASAGDLDP